MARRRRYPSDQEGRNPQPSAGLIDSQSVKGADTVGRDSRATTPARRSTQEAVHRHRHPRAAAHGDGLLRRAPGPRRRQDRPARRLPRYRGAVRLRRRRLRRPPARPGPQHPGHHRAHRAQTSRPARLRRHPTPWAVERTLGWINERDPAISEAMIRWAAINTMTRRLARGGPTTRQQRRTFQPAS
jgi:hypothetical protein